MQGQEFNETEMLILAGQLRTATEEFNHLEGKIEFADLSYQTTGKAPNSLIQSQDQATVILLREMQNQHKDSSRQRWRAFFAQLDPQTQELLRPMIEPQAPYLYEE